MDIIQKATYKGTVGDPSKPTEDDKRNKFNWIIVPSIATQWLNFPNLCNTIGCLLGGFGGWRKYASEHVDKTPGSDFSCNDSEEAKAIVHGRIWHFFDILLVIKIILAVIFICSLRYRNNEKL